MRSQKAAVGDETAKVQVTVVVRYIVQYAFDIIEWFMKRGAWFFELDAFDDARLAVTQQSTYRALDCALCLGAPVWSN